MEPVIGITVRTMDLPAAGRTRPAETLPRAFVDLLEGAGATVLLLPNARPDRVAAYLGIVDGLLLSGGDDPHPRVFGEDPHPRIDRVDPRRDAFELALIRAAHAGDWPVLGVCRGVQMMNIALGGDIWQDLVSQTDSRVCHAQKTAGGDAPWHDVDVAEGTLLGRLLGAGRRAVNSFHHQACRRVADPLRVAATTVGDGLIEALEDPGKPCFLGVQWHPELAPDTDGALFEALVEAARGRALASSKPRRASLSGR